MNKEYIISEIIRMEMEITLAISKGHKAHDNDQFKVYRELLRSYRKIIFENGK